jgi:CubicO group peptidase (beta-lactamase class C family)
MSAELKANAELKSLSTQHSALSTFLTREIALGSFPSASYAIGTASGIVDAAALGNAVAVPLRIRATAETVYDCASITKPLITATLVLQEVAAGRISLDESFHGYRVRDLLTHTTGLRAWMPLYAHGDYLAAILEHGREAAPGTKVIYSDLNFILLWLLLRERCGDFAALARERIFAPLGIGRDAMLNPPMTLKPRIAATEWGQRFEAAMCGVPFTGFREGLIWGETHDGNSHHAGGSTGNAGLFATAAAVFRIAQAIARGELLPRELVAEATRNHTVGLGDARGLGWQLQTEGSAATSTLSPRAYGHTGFTGTSLWIDPDADRILVLLTNRVHPCATANAMQEVRGEFHRLSLSFGERVARSAV